MILEALYLYSTYNLYVYVLQQVCSAKKPVLEVLHWIRDAGDPNVKKKITFYTTYAYKNYRNLSLGNP